MNPIVLMYHSVLAGRPADPYGVSTEAFQAQISWLLDQGYRFVPLASLAASKTDSARDDKRVVLTFDDGYRDFLTHAVPILARHRLPATVFLVTDMLGKAVNWSASSDQAPLMTEDEVRQLKSYGISIGSHTATHADLTALDDHELERQLVASRNRLAELGETFYAFSYPWGKCTDREVAAVKAAGYQCAVAIESLLDFSGLDPFRLGRVSMRRDMGIDAFKRLVARSTLRERIVARMQALALRD